MLKMKTLVQFYAKVFPLRSVKVTRKCFGIRDGKVKTFVNRCVIVLGVT